MGLSKIKKRFLSFELFGSIFPAKEFKCLKFSVWPIYKKTIHFSEGLFFKFLTQNPIYDRNASEYEEVVFLKGS